MSDAIGPGDWIVPADDISLRTYGPEARLVLQVFSAIGKKKCNVCGEQSGALVLANCPPLTPKSRGQCPNHWKPIRSDITSIERLLTEPIPADLVDA